MHRLGHSSHQAALLYQHARLQRDRTIADALDGSTDPVLLNPTQVDQLLQELRFVGQMVDDQMVVAHVRAVIALSEPRSDGASNDMVAIEFP